MHNSDKFFIVSEEKTTQVTFTEKTRNKINSFYKQKHGYLIHSWLYKGVGCTTQSVTLNYVYSPFHHSQFTHVYLNDGFTMGF